MTDNLIFLLNKLSYQIVTEALNNDKIYNYRKNDEKFIKKFISRVRQKGCDVLLGKYIVSPPPDPCVTDYGGNWSPFTLLDDYGKELTLKGASKCYEILTSSIKCLQEKKYDCTNDMLKFLLIMKGPFHNPFANVQNELLTLSGSDSLLNSMDSLSVFLDESLTCLSDGLSRRLSFKKALKYEESWTKIFDSKFQVLGEYSKKNLSSKDNMSFNSIFSAKSTTVSHSQSNSFVFADFCIDNSCSSEKNMFHLSKSICLNDNPLLDSLVENPIIHKLPSLLNNHGGVSKSSYFMKSSDQVKRKLHLLKEEDQSNGMLSCERLSSAECSNEEVSVKCSGIELKRNSNCSHSFAILYEKSNSYKSDDPSLSSTDSLLLIRDRRRNKFERNILGRSSQFSSKEIVLGLWEHDKSIIKEFRPELANSLPQLRMITTVEYVEDVKYLLTGINSGTFQYNTEENCFNILYGTCLSDVTPESLFHFSKEFIETGNCYVRLSTRATENGRSNLEHCTSISQAFWKSIFDYLELHYSMVIGIPVTTNLMLLKSSLRDIHDMIVTISNICKVVGHGDLPEGGQLLTYLFQIAEKINRPCVNSIVFGILQNCSSIYFKCILQPWMFKGHLGKQSNEFFIDSYKHTLNVKSRAYYNSFYIVQERIPCFLLGYENNIFNCGKSLHFLKLFNMEDKFCQVLEKADYPNMYPCLSDVELEKFEKNFKEFGRTVIEICGEGISIKNIRKEEIEKKQKFIEYVKECKLKQDKERELIRLRELEDLKAKKELQNKLLNEEISRMRAERERKKLEEQNAIKKIEEKIKKAAEKEKKIIWQEKKLVKNYYGELLKALDLQLNTIEVKKKNLQRLLVEDTLDLEIMDVINDNKQDSEPEKISTETTNIQPTPIDLNSNPITDNGLVDSSKVSIPETAPSVETLVYIGQTDENSLSIDENSNISAVFSPTNIMNETKEGNIVETIAEIEKDRAELLNVSKDNNRKSVSQRNVAATEAIKNKIKVLKSEFEIRNYEKTSPSIKRSVKNLNETFMTDAEKNKKKVMESEYNLLSYGSESFSIKSVPSKIQVAKEIDGLSNETKKNYLDSRQNLHGTDTGLLDALDFREIGLERKRDCLNLDDTLDATKSENFIEKMSNTDSLSSLVTPPNAIGLDIPGEDVEIEELIISPCRKIDSSTSGLLIKSEYHNALIRDTEISLKKFKYNDIFHSLTQLEYDQGSCTDLMKFKRYLRKSALVPLMIQEKLANDALLKHLIVAENLLSHLKSLRNYFFLNDGEFARNFTHNTFRSLAKCSEAHEFFERSNLSNIVNEALNYTIHGYEPNSQNLSFQIVKMPPFLNHSAHDVLAPFELTYKVGWPLNLILTEKALEKYQSIFRFLLKLKRINWTLNENSLYLNSYFKNFKMNRHILVGSPHYHKIQIYRHAMTQVIITLDDYIFSNGIQIPWINFMQDLETTENIDHLYQKHVRYIKDVLMRCFLNKTSRELLSYIHNAIELALKFHYTVISIPLEKIDGKYEHPKFSVLRITFNEFCTVIKTFLLTLKEKIATNQVISSHYVLIEKFDLKLT